MKWPRGAVTGRDTCTGRVYLDYGHNIATMSTAFYAGAPLVKWAEGSTNITARVSRVPLSEVSDGFAIVVITKWRRMTRVRAPYTGLRFLWSGGASAKDGEAAIAKTIDVHTSSKSWRSGIDAGLRCMTTISRRGERAAYGG